MDEERITKVKASVIRYLWLAKRGNNKRLLRGVRRTGSPTLTMLQLKPILTAMVEAELIMGHPTAGSKLLPVYILTPDEADRHIAKAEEQRLSRKGHRDEVEATRSEG